MRQKSTHPAARPLAPGVRMQPPPAVKRGVGWPRAKASGHRDLSFGVLASIALPRKAEVQHERAGRSIGRFSSESRKHPFS
jgi:hypothetical protein